MHQKIPRQESGLLQRFPCAPQRIHALAEVLLVFAMRKCPKCNREGTHPAGGSFYCDRHFRFRQMRQRARAHGKTVPAWDELDSLVPSGLACRVCRRQMRWFRKDGGFNSVITLQHDNDGTHRLICGLCNNRYERYGNALYTLDPGLKKCSACRAYFPLTGFHKCVGSWDGVRSSCKTCANHDNQKRRSSHVNQ